MINTYRKYRELFGGTARFSTGTRGRLERAIGRALFGVRTGYTALDAAVRSASLELRAAGVEDAEIPAILAAIVEDAGRACRADRASLLTGAPLWTSLQERVVASARRELAGGLTH